MVRRVVLLAGPLLVLWAAAAAMLAENGMRIPASLRVAPPPGRAEKLAAEAGARWRNAELAARDGTKLRAWYFEPRGWNGSAVILLHGVSDSRLGVMAHARLLLRHGYAVLLPDSRGHGESGGEWISYGVVESADVLSWAQWLETYEAPRALYGLGESMGAAILLESLAGRAPFRAVVAEAPFATFREIANDRVAQAAGVEATPLRHLTPLVVVPALLYARARHGVDLDLASPLRALASSAVPVLLIHGSADRNIPPDHFQRLVAAKGERVEWWEVSGAGHTAALAVDPVAFEARVVAFFQAHAAPLTAAEDN